MALYIRKPNPVDAIKWDGVLETAKEFMGIDCKFHGDSKSIEIPTGIGGSWICETGDYIVKSIIPGGFEIKKADKFESKYNPA